MITTNQILFLLVTVLKLSTAHEEHSETDVAPLICQEPRDAGPCKGSKIRYFYNVTSGECEEFIYGGCEGTRNRFDELDSCVTSCKSVTCPAVHCHMECADGFEVDSSGCKECRCRQVATPTPLPPGDNEEKHPCPLMECPDPCPGDAYVLDAGGCRTCECVQKNEIVCGPVCELYCEQGLQKDERGCSICKCEETPSNCTELQINCNIECPNGQEKDANGCPVCKCIGDVPPATNNCSQLASACTIYCPKGFEKDSAGCPVCRCIEESSPNSECPPMVSCHIFCPEGQEKDSKGCPMCKCIDSPPTDISGGSECPPLAPTCQMFCELGFAKNAEGCKICRCQENPCQSNPCASGEICTFETKDNGDLEAKCNPSPAAVPLVCQERKDSGPCKGSKIKYFYNITSGQCQEFIYGGCEGTENRFDELAACQSRCAPGTCSLTQCLMECPNGFQTDSKGCKLCSCLTPQSTTGEPKKHECPLMKCVPCPAGEYKYDANGCRTCECAYTVEQCPGLKVDCALYCPNGREKDSSGCPICKCVEQKPDSNQCPSVMVSCRMHCELGFAKDANGCQMCECQRNPCDELYCSENDKCVTETNENGILVGECVPGKRWCSKIACLMECENGFKFDEYGCEICKCLDHPPAPCSDISWCRQACEFGYRRDVHGCTKCDCLPNPCKNYAECNEDREVCEAFVYSGCPNCPVTAKCIEKTDVKRLRVALTYEHDRVRTLDSVAFFQEVTRTMSSVMKIEPATIIHLTVVEPSNTLKTTVSFHVLEMLPPTVGPHVEEEEEEGAVEKRDRRHAPTKVNLVEAAERLRIALVEDLTSVTFVVKTVSFVPTAASLTVMYHSSVEVTETGQSVDTSGDKKIVFAAVIIGLAFFVVCAIIMTVLYRSRRRREKANIIYKKAPTGDDTLTSSQQKM